MADTQIQGGSGSNWAWAIVVVVLLAILAWFIFAGGFNRSSAPKADVDIHVPASGNAGGGG
jgi:bacteriorhodopsin